MTTAAPTSLGGLPIETPPNNYLKALIHGPQGSGKTRLASTIAQLGPILMIDTIGEKGSRSFRGDPWEENVHVVSPTSITEFDDLYWDFAKGDHPFVGVMIDSMTGVQAMAIRWILGRKETTVSEIKKGGPAMRIQDWGTLRDLMSDVATFWMGLADGSNDLNHRGYHVVFTSQTKFPNPTEDDQAMEKASLELSGGGKAIALSAPDYVLFTDKEEDFNATPDSDGEYPERFLLRILSSRAATKARIPAQLRGKIPHTLGRGEQDLSLVTLGKVLGVEGMGGESA